MELKRNFTEKQNYGGNLLIVPYGIETKIHGMTIHYRYHF